MPTLVQVQILTLVQVQVARRDLPPLFDKAESSFWLSKEARQVAAAIRRWEST